MNILFFDTETTGLPKNWKAPMTDLNNWPRVIQLAWMVCNDGGAHVTEYESLIKPDGWTIPKEKFWIDNGFSTEKSEKEGRPMNGVIGLFLSDLFHCDIIVSHNMSFDYNVLGAEMIRAKISASKKPIKICTKEVGTEYCKLPGNYGKYKWPKLIELHEKLFNAGFEGAHDALSDVIACKDCFFELVKLGVIKL